MNSRRYRGGFSLARLLTLLAMALLFAAGSQRLAGAWPILWAQALDDSSPGDEELDDADELDDTALEPEPADERIASPGTEAQQEGEDADRTLFRSLMQSGFCGLIIFLLSIVGVAFIVEHSLTIRRGVLMPEELVQQIDELVQNGHIDEAVRVSGDTADTSLFSNVVHAGLERYKSSEFGFAEYRAAAEEAGEDQSARLYRKTEVLGVIGAIAPMFGLLGTVSGMIRAFDQIAATRGMARPHELAGGISEALITTFMGLIVAIPSMVAFSYFRNRIDSIVAEAVKRVEQILAPLARRR